MKSDRLADRHAHFMQAAIRLSRRALTRKQGGPFGAVIVREGRIIARGWNQVIGTHDPTAHAEVVAIREACRKLRQFHLDDCVIYSSCEPCPMCLSAIYWARLGRVYYAATRSDAARIGFQDRTLYREIQLSPTRRQIPFHTLLREDARQVMQKWTEMEDHVEY
jgi:tRNA(Arg) A34 adenosine deaminase TadA